MADKFFEAKFRAFRRKYPTKAGWSVFQINFVTGIEMLPALLRARAIDVREDIRVMVSYHDGPRSHPLHFDGHPQLGQGPGLHDGNWFGTMEFRWQDTPLVFQRHRQEASGMMERDFTLVATTNRSALNDLTNALQDFWRSIYGQENDVYIANGDSSSIQLPKLGWGDMILPDKMCAEIKSNVESFFESRDHYRKMGLPFRRGFLFAGPPGGGKTTAAKIVIANAAAKSLALSVKGDIKDSTIENAFREAANRAPAILLIEDLDKLVRSKDVCLSFLLNLLDGLDTYEGFLLIATSNEPEKIDPALLHRPSRFDRVWHFGLPGVDERRRLLGLRSLGKFSDKALNEVAEASGGFSMAYVQEVAVSAILQALHEGREPLDTDLASSLTALKAQYRSNDKATGALPQVDRVGFHASGG